MNHIMLGLLAETFIHSGIGRNEGAIDLPVAREAATDYPYIPGSSLKGALRDFSRGHWKNGDADKVEKCFGKEGAEQAGGVLISDARLLLLPVRSLTGSYRWATCPLILERLKRDQQRLMGESAIPKIDAPGEGKYLGQGSDDLYLEERVFHHDGVCPGGLATAIRSFIRHDETKQRLAKRLIVLHDDDFAWFARYALPVQARNVLDENKKSKNLWYEESLPPDTLMYALLAERNDDSGITDLKTLLENKPYLQTGGNETVGMGWFAMRIHGNGEGGQE